MCVCVCVRVCVCAFIYDFVLEMLMRDLSCVLNLNTVVSL